MDVFMRMLSVRLLLLCLVVAITAPVSARELVGWAEMAVIHPGNLSIRAKIDTGAKTSSLNCECHDIYEKDGEQWLRFSVDSHDGTLLRLDRKVHRFANIKRHFGGIQERPVIMLGICLGGVYRETEVNVIDRSGLDFPLLIGRQFLEEKFLVDAGTRYINPPHCDINLEK
jgi:hypothetical protein